MKNLPATNDANITASLPERIAADLRLKIASGNWAPGTALPTRRELAKTYGVALRTIEQAVAPLIAEGALETKGVKGTFVAPDAGREIDASRIAYSAPSRPTFDQSTEISIGIVGTWSGIHGENMVESVGARAIEHEASGYSHVSLHYFNRYIGRDVPGIPMTVAAQTLLNEGVDGLIAFTPEGVELSQHSLDSFLGVTDAAGIPVVMFNRAPANVQMRQVVYDDVFAGYEAAQHLLSRGWRSLAFLAPFDAYWIADRRKGAQQAVNSQISSPLVEFAVIPAPEDVVAYIAYGQYRDEGFRIGKEFLRTMREPAAIIACNDMVAYGVLDAAAGLHLDVGTDFAIIGFDDYINSRHCGLSSVRPPLEHIGAECVDVIMRAVRGERTPLIVTLRSEVVARTSTARPRRAKTTLLSGTRQKELIR
ncbi:MAG: GntR family transcriptional regulator [Capsulimonadaceae bacterium]|nr:GntR family transcriptional regulator [Capsulimonadaceae bacterium]